MQLIKDKITIFMKLVMIGNWDSEVASLVALSEMMNYALIVSGPSPYFAFNIQQIYAN